MKTKNLLIAFFLITLLSCYNKKEYVYNEAIANYYFSVSDQFENVYKKFSDGELKTKYEHKDSEVGSFFDFEKSEIKNLKNNTAESIRMVEMQNPSDAAKDFHKITLEYMKMVENDFTTALKNYTDINCDCPKKRDSLKIIVDGVYGKICDKEDKMQQIQLEYMNKTGFKPESRKNN